MYYCIDQAVYIEKIINVDWLIESIYCGLQNISWGKYKI